MDPKRLPAHIAIIMDGNGRWARQRMLQRVIGHRKGVETVQVVVDECAKLGIRYLTLFAFSAENWLRPAAEVKALMALLKTFITADTARMMHNNTRFNVVGDRSDLPADVNQALDRAISATAGNGGMVLTLALSYGSRQEITRAARELAADAAAGRLDPSSITEEVFAGRLWTAGIPDPDFLIRTSGEMRISNFLLWQLAYTELYFTEVNWPDFNLDELHRAIRHYQSRERRFGRTSEQLRDRS
ncbi:MAG TPA: isoprenyl transferase [Verrucomicrobiae bacterium]|nr:isoprenyl transferase [Verrucomicrobiae bacterium]